MRHNARNIRRCIWPFATNVRQYPMDETGEEPMWWQPPPVKVVFFYSSKCPDCSAVSPAFTKVARQFRSGCLFCKVQFDRAPALARALGVWGTPTIVFCYKEEVVAKVIGSMGLGQLRVAVRNFLRQMGCVNEGECGAIPSST